MSFTIIKNAGPPRPRGQTYPLAELDVGDAFDIPLKNARDKRSTLKVQNCACNAVVHYRKKHPEKKFTTRTIGDVVRVYRTA